MTPIGGLEVAGLGHWPSLRLCSQLIPWCRVFQLAGRGHGAGTLGPLETFRSPRPVGESELLIPLGRVGVAAAVAIRSCCLLHFPPSHLFSACMQPSRHFGSCAGAVGWGAPL